MTEDTTIEDMLQQLFEVKMGLFFEQCELIFTPLEDIAKAEELKAVDFDAPEAHAI